MHSPCSTTRTSLLTALALLPLCTGCTVLSRPAAGSATVPYRDTNLLEADAPSLRIEVDYIAGGEPRPRALRIFERRLAFYCDKPGGIEVEVDDEIGAEEWEENAESVGELARKYADGPGEEAYLYVLYAPCWKKYRGYSFRKGKGGADYPMMVAFTDQLNPILWITGVRQEASVLIHEAGHLLGLVTNDVHRDGGHCTNGWCLMYDGVDARSLAVHLLPTLFGGYLPTHFCRDCRADLWEDERAPGIRRVRGIPGAGRPGCNPRWEEGS